MKSIKKFFVVPIGLPGMGKTTLSKFLMNSKNYEVTYPMPQGKFGHQGINLGQKMKRVTNAQGNYVNGNSQDSFGLLEKHGPGAENAAQQVINAGFDGLKGQYRHAKIKLDFMKISYDYILTTKA